MKVNGMMATKKEEAPRQTKSTALITLSVDSGVKDSWKVVQPTCIMTK